jgi:hypothetical protein
MTEVFLPLFSQKVESLLWNSKVGATSVDDSWILLLISKLELFSVIKHISSFKSPLFDGVHPVWSISHGLNLLQSADASNDLISIKSSKNCIGCIRRLRA